MPTIEEEKKPFVNDGVVNDPCCMGKTLDHISFSVNLSSYSVQIKKFDGKDHIVVPVVMLAEGVHNGSDGLVYYSAEEIAKFPNAWNGVPVPLYHPLENGFPISCNSPEVLESYSMGRVFAAQVLENGKKLKAELWLDVAKVQALDPALLAKINSKQPIEVSTGLFFDVDMTEGEWNGEKYSAIAKNFRPDHLAILPSGTGACSVADGCGIRANSEAVYQKLWQRLVSNVKDASFQEVMEMIRQQVLLPMDKRSSPVSPGFKDTWLKVAWPTYFIYEVEESGQPEKLYQQSYSLSKDKKEIILDGPPIEVIETRSYKTVQNKSGGKKVDRKQKIEYLTANGYSLDEQAWEAIPDGVLESMVSQVEKVLSTNALLTSTQAEVETLKANAAKKPGSPEEFIAQAPADIQATLNRAMARDRQMKKDLVEKLTKNQSIFSLSELEAKPLEELEKLSALASPKDFSLKGGQTVPVTNAEDETPMEVPTFNFAKK